TTSRHKAGPFRNIRIKRGFCTLSQYWERVQLYLGTSECFSHSQFLRGPFNRGEVLGRSFQTATHRIDGQIIGAEFLPTFHVALPVIRVSTRNRQLWLKTDAFWIATCLHGVL